MQMLSQAARASRSDAVDVTTTATNDSELRLGESVTTPLWQHLACRTRRTQAGQHHQTAETAPESALLQKRPRDRLASVTTTHDSKRRPNVRARSTTRTHCVTWGTTSPLHTRSRCCGRTALKPACLRACSVMWQNGQQQRDSTAEFVLKNSIVCVITCFCIARPLLIFQVRMYPRINLWASFDELLPCSDAIWIQNGNRYSLIV